MSGVVPGTDNPRAVWELRRESVARAMHQAHHDRRGYFFDEPNATEAWESGGVDTGYWLALADDAIAAVEAASPALPEGRADGATLEKIAGMLRPVPDPKLWPTLHYWRTAPPAAAVPDLRHRLVEYIEARGIPWIEDRDTARLTEEMYELETALIDGRGDEAVRYEIADVALALTVLASSFGWAVEDCITEKTEHDRNRGEN